MSSAEIWNAVVGVTSAGSMVVACLALAHSVRLDRRLRLEEYFRRRWPTVHEAVATFSMAWTKWFDETAVELRQAQYVAIPMPPELELPDISAIDWSYDRKLQKLLVDLQSCTTTIRQHAMEYRKLIEIATIEFRGMRNLGEVVARLERIEGLAETKSRADVYYEEMTEFAKRVCAECGAERDELESNKAYQSKRAALKATLASQLERITPLLAKIRLKVEEYGTRFCAAGEA